MPVTASDRAIVESVLRAMQAGPGGEELMMSLFWDDAVLIEPFSGRPLTHTGKAAIRVNFRQHTAQPLPNMKLVLDRVDVNGEIVRADWKCTSSAFPAPMRGHDLYTIRNGKVARLEIVVDSMPGPPG